MKRSQICAAAAAITLIVSSSLAAAAAAAAAPPPPPPPPAPAPLESASRSPVAPTTRPSPEQLHAQAYEFMRAGQLQRAQAPLEQAYKARPLAQQPRPLVLNHALLDVAIKTNAMRAVKDLRDYLGALEKGDEHAVNLLGAALLVAGREERMQETELYTAAEKQLEQSIKLVEKSRPGERKWGSEWKPEAEHAELHAKRAATNQSFREAKQALRKALNDAQEAAAKVDRLEDKGAGSKKKVVAKRTAALEAAYRESAEAEKRYAQQKTVVEAARKNLFEPTWSTDLAPIDPATPNAGRVTASTRPAKPSA
jgi:tetratricopeptide (TPR) repeat protein